MVWRWDGGEGADCCARLLSAVFLTRVNLGPAATRAVGNVSWSRLFFHSRRRGRYRVTRGMITSCSSNTLRLRRSKPHRATGFDGFETTSAIASSFARAPNVRLRDCATCYCLSHPGYARVMNGMNEWNCFSSCPSDTQW